jgi:hypothetical protein
VKRSFVSLVKAAALAGGFQYLVSNALFQNPVGQPLPVEPDWWNPIGRTPLVEHDW